VAGGLRYNKKTYKFDYVDLKKKQKFYGKRKITCGVNCKRQYLKDLEGLTIANVNFLNTNIQAFKCAKG
jgi:hypothetical protein